MGVKQSVFASKMERANFRKLSETWGKDYHIYHNLPFLNVFSAKDELIDANGIPFSVSESDYDALKKTSIDFTLCDKTDVPLVCVDFDGMQDGFNVGTEYHLRDGSEGKKARRAFMEIKLKVAHGSHFPYLVLGSPEFRGLSDSVRLTIADGLIGEVMSTKAVQKRVAEGFEPTNCGFSQEEFDNLPEYQKTEVIENWLLEIEVEADLEHNPIFREVCRLETKLHASGQEVTFLNGPAAPERALKWVSLESKVTGRAGTASAKITLPDYRTPYCYFSVHIAMEVARLVALAELDKKS